jgi:hypothetical protein
VLIALFVVLHHILGQAQRCGGFQIPRCHRQNPHGKVSIYKTQSSARCDQR